MYSLLVVDDEQIVLESVSHVVTKYCSHIDIVGLARSGSEAVALAREYKPDIVLMDIELYGLNGLDAIEEIKEALPDTVFVIISAYDSFSYAKKSLELGVMEYLLKPVSKDDILQVLNKAVSRIDGFRRARKEELRLKEKLQQMMPLIEEDFFFVLLYPGFFSRDFERYREILEWHFAYGQAVLVVGQPNRLGSEYGKRLSELIRRRCPSSGKCLVSPVLGRSVVILHGFDVPLESDEAWRRMCSYLEGELKSKVSVLLGRAYPGFGGLVRSYRELRQAAFSYEFTRGVRSVNPAAKGDADTVSIPWEQENRLYSAVEAGSVETSRVELQRLYEVARQRVASSLQGQKDYFHEIIAVLLRLLYEYVPEQELRSIDAGMYRRQIDSIKTEQEVLPTIEGIVLSMVQTIRAVKTDDYHPVIARAKAFMDANYHRNIGLTEISESVAVSPSYLCKLFKESVGQTVVDYLTDVRMEEALRLLRSTKLPVRVIASRVGYSDANYFSKVFKKATGFTPTSLRRQAAL